MNKTYDPKSFEKRIYSKYDLPKLSYVFKRNV